LVGGSISASGTLPKTASVLPRTPSHNAISMLSKNVFSCSIVGKRKAETLESPAKRVDVRPPPPISGGRPLFTFDVHVGSKVFKAATMPDSGATVCMANVNFINHYSVPKVKRDRPIRVHDFAGRIVPGVGAAFTFPLTINHGNHWSRESFEIGPLEDGIDLILPFWWLCKHKPAGFFEGQLRFDDAYCEQKCTREAAQEFSIEYDPSILEIADYDISAVCYIGTIVKTDQGPEIKDIRSVLPERYHKYINVFLPETARELPPHTVYDHAIDLKEGTQPPWGPIYALSETELKALREYLDEMIKMGKIRPSKSPAGAPILFVPKPHGRGLRMCVDYRGLNKVSIMNRYPLPLMNELRDRVQGSRWFSKIDLKGAYNLVRIKKGDEWKTAFRTRYGHYEYLVMPFGLANAPATFQAMMQEILRDLLDHGVVVYIDDILIYSESESQHELLVSEVLRRLQEHGLAGAIDKSEFHKKSVEFLGYIITADGVAMSEEKLVAIREWAEPKNVKDVQSFIGFANFYRRFIEGFSRVCKPLTDTLKGQGKNFSWDEICTQAFKELKERFTSAPILRHFNPSLQPIMETDASDFAIGAVLSQRFEDGKLHPNAFFSRKMQPAEINYEIHDKEMLAIVAAFKEWKRYLEGAKHQVLIFTDHKNLEYFATTKVLNRRQARWAQELAAYDFKITYRPGTSNGKPDALSRRSEYRPLGGDSGENQPIHTVLKAGQLESPERFLSLLAIGGFRAALAGLSVEQFKPEFLDRVRSFIPGDEVYNTQLRLTEEGKGQKGTTVEEGLLYYKNRLWIPDSNELRQEIATSEHDSKVAGHFGQGKTLELMTRHFFWPNLEKWVEDYVRSCDECQRNKSPRHARFGLLQPLELSYRPWSSISMDFIIELPESGEGYSSIWVIVDRFTKMAHFVPLKKPATAENLAKVFVREIWRLHGLPTDIVSDRDSRFTSEFWQSTLTLLGIRPRMSTSFHPQTDGQTEKVNQSIELYVRTFCNYEQDDWYDLLPLAEYAYNNSVTSGNGLSPFYANYGYHPRTNWPTEEVVRNPASEAYVHYVTNVHELCKNGLKKTQERMAKYYDQHHKEAPAYKIGDQVMLHGRNISTRRPSRKFDHKMHGPFKVVKLLSRSAVRLELPRRWRIHDVFHVSLLEPYRQATLSGRAPPDLDRVLEETEDVIPANEFLPLRIHDSARKRRERKLKVCYLVEWDGWPNVRDYTWEPYEHLDESARAYELVKIFHQENPEKPRDPEFSEDDEEEGRD
jgi:hypothetical protein